jgi:hypothetical protein
MSTMPTLGTYVTAMRAASPAQEGEVFGLTSGAAVYSTSL